MGPFATRIGGDSSADAVLKDARISAVRALQRIPIADGDKETFGRIMKWSLRAHADDTLALVELRLDLTPGLAALILARQALHWGDGGALAFDNFEVAFGSDVRGIGNDIAPAVMNGLLALAKAEESGLATTDAAVQAFGRIADVVEAAGHFEDALASALSAANLLRGLDPKVLERPLSRALALARKLGKRDIAAVCLARKAAAYLSADDSGPRRLEAFSTLEELVKAPPTTAEAGKLAMRAIGPRIEKVSPGLQLLVRLALGQYHLRDQLPPGAEQLLPLLPMEWNLNRADLLPAIRAIREAITDAEEERLALLPPVSEDQAEASWTDFSIFHPVFQRSMPLTQSFRKLPNYQENLLAIQHELTHIESMSSHIGNALLAIRAALLETETDLWALLGHQGKEKITQDVFTRALAPLRGDNGDPLALAYAERELELILKAAALRETWAPWFEGLAVFAELHGDSTDDEAISPTSMVIMNLEDHPLSTKADSTGANSDGLLRERMAEAERVYAAAARAVGPFRLRTYLDNHAAKYLPGYLAVRSVVASWRRRFRGPLGGSQALRALMHITQYGSDEGVPHLGLPLAPFRDAASAGMRAWIETVANVSADDLARVLSAYTRPDTIGAGIGWRGGRLEQTESRITADSAEDIFQRRTDEALSTLAGPHGRPERVGDFNDDVSDELLKGILATVADSLQQRRRTKRLMTLTNVNRLMERYRILPIAETSAPFWLNVPTQSLVATVRVGVNGATGNSLYTTLAIPLNTERWEALRAEANRTGAARMTITRVAELGEMIDEQDLTRGLGTHYLVFRLEGWMHVTPAGAFFGAPGAPPEVEATIHQRLFPDPIANMESMTAMGVRCAERTGEWIAAVSSWGLNEEQYPLERWAQHVFLLTGDIIFGNGADPEQADRCGRALLSLVFGDTAVADEVAARGLAIGTLERTWMAAAIRLLAQTGGMPTADLPADAGAIPPQVLATFFEHSHAGWDVRIPAHLQGGSTQ